jgi:hypothetical protein
MFIQDTTVVYVNERKIRDFLLLPQLIQKNENERKNKK